MTAGRSWKSGLQLGFVLIVRAVAVAVVAGLLMASAVKGSSAEGLDRKPGSNGSPSSDCWRPKKAELEFARRMNVARIGAARSGLELDPEISAVARRHTRRMAANQRLAHSSRAVLRRRVTHWNSLAENVGVGSGPAEVHSAFMASDAHRANMLEGSYRYVGIGTRSSSGRTWVTVIFEAKKNPGTTLSMPDCSDAQ